MEQGRYNQDDLYAQWNDPWATQPPNTKNNKQGHHSWRQQLTSADRSDPYAHNFPQQYPQLPPPPHLQHQHASGYYDSYYVTNNFAG